MVRTSFSGQEIASVLTSHGYHPVDRTGSHLKLRYEHPDTGEVRVVTVPMKSADPIPTGTLQSIADQYGAKDFHAWCRWIDENRWASTNDHGCAGTRIRDRDSGCYWPPQRIIRSPMDSPGVPRATAGSEGDYGESTVEGTK
jgi:predicted RNA binding protein YcfA (HicA-like mRNA interferase family)